MSNKNKPAKKSSGFEFKGGFSVGTMNAGEKELTNRKEDENEEEDENESGDEGEDEEQESDDGGDMLNDLPPEVQRRVKALRSMHDEMDTMQAEYRKERAALEKKYAAKRDEFYSQRKEIVQGTKDVPPEEDAPADSEDSVKGIPSFWAEVISGHPDLGVLFSEDDIPALNALTDISCTYSEDYKSFVLNFHFKENEYFTNSVLTKKYEVEPDLFDDAPGLANCEGCEIDWKVGKNLCMAEIKKKQKAKSGKNKGQIRVVTRTVPKPSFFNFFKSPIHAQEVEGEDDEDDDEEQDQMGPRTKFAVEEDYDIAHVIRTSIIPEAILYFTNEKEFDMYDMDEDDDDEDGDEDGDDDDDEGGKAQAAPAGEKPQECKQN